MKDTMSNGIPVSKEEACFMACMHKRFGIVNILNTKTFTIFLNSFMDR